MNDARTDAGREERLAEERALYMTQTAIQRQLNRQGLRYRDLARRLEVSEARVSQLLGDDALNLTVRTVARIFHRLGEQVVVLPQRELDELLGERAVGDDQSAWVFAAAGEEIYAGQETTEIVVASGTRRIGAAEWRDWADAEAASDRARKVA